MLQSGYISWKLTNSKDVPQGALAAATQIESIAGDHPQLAYYLFMYRFAADKSQQAYEGANTADWIFKVITKTPYDFHQRCKGFFRDDRLFAFLVYLGHADSVLHMKSHCTGEIAHDVELLYGLFESICMIKSSVREHYYKFGPRSHLYWLQQNLGLYEFNTPKAKETKKRIESFAFTPESTISELSSSFQSLSAYQKDFRDDFQNNILLASWGIAGGKEKPGITSSNSDAYYLESFYDQPVPVGYYRLMQARGDRYDS